MSSDASRNTQASQAGTPSEQRESMDLALQQVLYNPVDRIERAELLLRDTIASSLSTQLPERIEAPRPAAQILDRFFEKVRNGMERLRRSNASIAGDATVIAASLRRELSSFTDALGTPEEAEGEVSTTVREAVAQATHEVRAMVAAFTAEALRDEAIDSILESPFADTVLETDSFLDVREEKSSTPAIPSSQASTRFTSALITQVTGSTSEIEETPDVPPFRWSWTDDELFLERKLPKMRRLKGKKRNFGSFLFLLKTRIMTGFYHYQHPVASLAKKTPRRFKTEAEARKFFDDLGKELGEHLNTFIHELQQMFSTGMMTEKLWKFEISKTADELKYIFKEKKMPNPLFIQKALDQYVVNFEKACKDTQYPLSTIAPAHISSSNIVIFNRDSRIHADYESEQASSVFKNALLIGCSAGAKEDMKGTIKKFLNGKYDMGKQEEQKKMMETVGNRLLQKLSTIDTSRLEQRSTTLVYIQTMKARLEIVLQCIEQFHAPEVPPHLLGVMKNAASFHVCWNFREFILADFASAGLPIVGKYLEEMEDFYPAPPEPTVLEEAAAEESVASESSEDIQQRFIDPLSAIADRARQRRAERAAQEEAQVLNTLVIDDASDEHTQPSPTPKYPSSNSIARAAFVALDIQEGEQPSPDDVRLHLCRGIGHQIASAAAVLVPTVHGAATPSDIEAFGVTLQSVTSAVCTALDAHLKQQSADEIPTPEHVAAAVRAALEECDGVLQTLDANVRAKLRSDIEAIAAETHETDEEGFLDLLSSGAIADVSGGDGSLTPSAIERAVRTTVQAQASQRITEGLARIRLLMTEAHTLLGDGHLMKQLTELERRHSEGDTDALSIITTIVEVLKSANTLASHSSISPIK